MSILLILLSFVLTDAGLVKALLDCSESAWQQLGDETVPPEQDLETFADLANKLPQMVPRRFLAENVTDALPPRRGEIVRLEGKIVSVTKYDGKVPVYRCRMVLNGGMYGEIFTPSVPQDIFFHTEAQRHEEELPSFVPLRASVPPCENNEVCSLGDVVGERTAAFAIYIKSYNGTPIFVASAIEWYPDTWLGNLGFNVASFDQVPVSRVTELELHDEESNRLMFKFTEADVEPFYGLLRAVSATPEGWLEEEAKKRQDEEPVSVIDLFNRPGETRGKPVLLRGTAKRIVPTPVTDSAVQSLFGIDHYYQIFLFTKEARGNPIVVCVHSLPEGMSTGDADDFAEEITVAAVPYKLWIYETQPKPHYAPLLVGRSLTWHPAQSSETRRVPAAFATFSFAAFCTLAILWIACRFWARRFDSAS